MSKGLQTAKLWTDRFAGLLKGDRDMEIIVLITALIALDILALRYGADSREGVDRDRRTLGLLR